MSLSTTKRGFTLIELLVVIAIIGLLASVVIASLNSARQKGRDARRIADIKSIQLALELFYDANGKYPTSAQYTTSGAGNLAPSYIAAVPQDPTTGADYVYAGLQGSAATAATCGSYHIGAALESVTGSSGVLGSDVDASTATICTGGGTDFAGLSAACTATAVAATSDKCYDLKP